MTQMNTYKKSEELLSEIANSMYDRNVINDGLLLFTGTEIQLVDRWLNDILTEYKKSLCE